ncbi:MAG: serine hydrolase [Pseudomonadales bacterium]|nr:serine hydrolase [Pseudomonadales bacterium]
MRVIKGIVALVVILIASVFLLGPFVGLPPNYIIHGPNVASGIGSKLLCSSLYVSGYSREQAFRDLVQYSPILEQLTIDYDDASQSVTTSLFGIQAKTASALPDLGCAVDYEGFNQRHELSTQSVVTSQEPWPLGGSVDSIDDELQKLLESLVAADNISGFNTRALLVVHAGEIVAEAYDQEATVETPLLGWSMAKSLVAVALGNLEYRGLLDLKQTPGFAEWDDERSRITIVDMLNMADGLEFSEEYDPGDDATAMLFAEPSAANYVLQQSSIYEPGEFFNYSSGTANLLAKLHSDALGSPQIAYDDFRENISLPIGFQKAIFETDASGVFVGSSYLYASARDWARLGQLMLNGGTINNQRIVSEDWVIRATSPNNTANEKAYGYQWWLNRGDENLRYENLPVDMFYATGNRQQYVMVFPSLDTVIVRLGWTAGRYPVDQKFENILEMLSSRN